MCLPKCGRPDGPKCYRNPRKPKPELLITPQDRSSTAIQRSSVYAATPFVQVIESDAPVEYGESIPDIVDCLNVNDQQALARREKSRLAAKLRRQKENQALVKLRLTLPIHAYRPLPSDRNLSCLVSSPVSKTDTIVSFDASALEGVQSYRNASCLSTFQHQNPKQPSSHIWAPEFEKAVTVRLAGNSLCLYNWLYPTLLSESQPSDRRSFSHSKHSEGKLSPVCLDLLSQSLVLIVVDTTENSVVYASPSYCRLLGLPWNTTIGLHLSELRQRQYAALTANNTTNGNLKANRVVRSQTSVSSRSPSPPPPHAAFHHNVSFRTLLERRIPRTISTSSLPSMSHKLWSAEDDYWPIDCNIVKGPLTSLLPPEKSFASSSLDEMNKSLDGSVVNNKEALLKANVFAISWGSQPLLPSGKFTNTSKINFSAKDAILPKVDGRLRAFLLHPVVMSPCPRLDSESLLDHVDRSTELSRSHGDPCVSDVLCGSYADLVTAPRSFHLIHDWKFVDAHHKFLMALGWTQSDLCDYSLLDLLHPDDLPGIVETLECMSESEPVLTSLHRIRCGDGHYRWSRMLAFLMDRHTTSLWSPKSYDPGTCTQDAVLDSPECLYITEGPEKGVSTRRVLVCCHQFVHLSTEPQSSLPAMEALHSTYSSNTWQSMPLVAPTQAASNVVHTTRFLTREHTSNSLEPPPQTSTTPPSPCFRHSFTARSSCFDDRAQVAAIPNHDGRTNSYPDNLAGGSEHPVSWNPYMTPANSWSHSGGSFVSGNVHLPRNSAFVTAKTDWDLHGRALNDQRHLATELFYSHEANYTAFPRCSSTDTGISVHMSSSDLSGLRSSDTSSDVSTSLLLTPSSQCSSSSPHAFSRPVHPDSPVYCSPFLLPQAEILPVCNGVLMTTSGHLVPRAWLHQNYYYSQNGSEPLWNTPSPLTTSFIDLEEYRGSNCYYPSDLTRSDNLTSSSHHLNVVPALNENAVYSSLL